MPELNHQLSYFQMLTLISAQSQEKAELLNAKLNACLGKTATEIYKELIVILNPTEDTHKTLATPRGPSLFGQTKSINLLEKANNKLKTASK